MPNNKPNSVYSTIYLEKRIAFILHSLHAEKKLASGSGLPLALSSIVLRRSKKKNFLSSRCIFRSYDLVFVSVALSFGLATSSIREMPPFFWCRDFPKLSKENLCTLFDSYTIWKWFIISIYFLMSDDIVCFRDKIGLLLFFLRRYVWKH